MAIATLYQASDDIYGVFDKVMLLYDGRQIFFGLTSTAQAYFVNLGFVRSPRSSMADFLCSITNPAERIVKLGWESRVPRIPDDFARVWRASPERQQLAVEFDLYQQEYPPQKSTMRQRPFTSIGTSGRSRS